MSRTNSDANLDGHLPKCRWLVFDAVGTLIDPHPTVAAAYHAVGSRFGTRYSIAEVDQRFRAAFRFSESEGFPGGLVGAPWTTSDDIERARWRWIVQDVFPDVHDLENCFHELWEHFAQPASWRCFGDVEETLTQLSTLGYRLAIASNFDCRLHPVCDGLPALKPIELRIVSAGVGYRKPAPEFYRALVAACDCQPSEILMIGDDFAYDVAAARAAGLQALHLDRKSQVSEIGAISSLIQMAKLLDHPAC